LGCGLGPRQAHAVEHLPWIRWPRTSQFDTKRSEVGEALYQLKYRGDLDKVQPLAKEIATYAAPQFKNVGFIVPMPPSTERARQPVTEIAKSLSEILKVPMFDNILVKLPPDPDAKPSKDLVGKEAKVAALKERWRLAISPAGVRPRSQGFAALLA
jgi:predicted amidophosphoribosyltransferase